MTQQYLKKMRWTSLQNIIPLKLLIYQCVNVVWLSLSFLGGDLGKNRYGTDALENVEIKMDLLIKRLLKIMI